MTSTSADGIEWDLTDLYEGPEDPQLEQDIKKSIQKAQEFREKYNGKIEAAELSFEEFREAMEEYEEIFESINKISSFASLYHAMDTQDPDRGALLQRVEQKKSEVKNKLIFFELEWQSLSEEEAEGYLESEELEHYESYLNNWRRYTPYMLSEQEEQIIESLQNTAKEAFKRLFDQTIGDITVEFEVEEESHEMVLDQALSVLYEEDREKRKAAADAVTESLKEENKLLNFIFNNIVQNHTTICQFRDYPDPMTPRNLDNRVDRETVDALMETVEENTDIVERFYNLKKDIGEFDKLFDYDRYSPLPGGVPETDFEESREKVLDAYEKFTPKMRDIAEKFFEKDWIDAEIKEGKRGGAFSASTVPSVHPYIMLNFSDKTSDMITMAHELGHGVHQYLAREQGALQQSTPLTTAEMASVFGEMLLFDKLMNDVDDEETKLVLIANKLQRDFATVFRQVIMTRFEQKLHEAQREGGELKSEEINELWTEANQEEFGDSVELRDEYGWWWSYVLHFVHYPFYCYAYAFGELLVLALYDIYQEKGEEFVPQYIELLKAGGSEDPKDLLKKIGIDISDPDFWERGIKVLEEKVEEMEELAESSGKI
ncbi:MAG: M3 family oligoendopeptidase [Candidatus Thermoplasmatota archaeon]|nr:M3 family oligoendopeptidase [Candidatus Thermoplasmatota archaeon]MBS3790409.1 M3 family oligoendopeptidase [Candidatus Thermoplasmatota archaeon]